MNLSGKIIAKRRDGSLVRAYAFDTAGKQTPVSFDVTSVDYLMAVGENASAMVLISGLKIGVALPLHVLEEKIFSPGFEDIVDLLSVTGEAFYETLPLLQDDFREASEKPGKGILITAILRKPQSNETCVFDFQEGDILSFQPIPSRSKSGFGVELNFKRDDISPFGKRVIIDMPYDDFIVFLASAKEKNSPLNLVSVFAKNPQTYGLA